MNMDMEYTQDEKTILANPQGQRPANEPLTDFAQPPRFEELEERMIYAASRRPDEGFNISINPLVSAAAPLFSAIVRIKHSVSAQDPGTLKAELVRYIKHFEAQALNEGVENSQVMAARYVLSTAVDEAVVTTQWGNDIDWSSISMLSSFHNETFGGEKFFQLLDRLGRNPVKHLPMLELMYICLSLGFEGKYRVIPRGMIELDGIRDSLYRQIRQLRGDVPRELSPHWEGLSEPRRSLVRIVPWWLVVASTAICLVVMYTGFAYVLGEKREAVLKLYEPIDPVMLEHKP